MIIKAALILLRGHKDDPELLFVRAKDKDFYIFPGGKLEPSEHPQDALRREIAEELQVSITHIQNIGVVDGLTPDGQKMRMHLFTGTLVGAPKPNAEIVEIHWVHASQIVELHDRMTPMTKEKVLPFLVKEGLWLTD